MAPVILSEKDKDRIQTLRIFCVEIFIAAPIFSLVYGRAGSPESSLLLLCAMPLAGFTYFVWRIFNSPAAAGNWILGFGYLLLLLCAYWTGGIESPFLTWSVLIPVLGTLICSRRSGAIWLGMVLLKFLIFYGIHQGWLSASLPPSPLTGENARTVIYFSISGLIIFAWVPVQMAERFKERHLDRIEVKNRELTEAMQKIQQLKGLLPMCAWCRKIRNDKGYWDGIETYFKEHAGVEFTHGMCPECRDKQSKLWKHGKD